MKILFLDIDGVLNSKRSAVAFSHFPWTVKGRDLQRFDKVAVALIRKVCLKTGALCVLSSTWRNHTWWEQIGPALKLPILDRTPDKIGAVRGKEIDMWLEAHPEVHTYAIVDDDRDMLEEQKPFFVQTDNNNGLTLQNYDALIKILGELV